MCMKLQLIHVYAPHMPVHARARICMCTSTYTHTCILAQTLPCPLFLIKLKGNVYAFQKESVYTFQMLEWRTADLFPLHIPFKDSNSAYSHQAFSVWATDKRYVFLLISPRKQMFWYSLNRPGDALPLSIKTYVNVVKGPLSWSI